MGMPREPRPAKYFVALLSSEIDLVSAVEGELESALSEIDGRSEIVPWTASKFYEKEMGPGLKRQFLSLSKLASPQELAAVKLKTQAIEARFRVAASTARRVNLDPGYVDTHKVVLASTKDAGQRIYLSSGIYGEATLLYFDGDFHGLPYTYPDYLWPEAREFFARLRDVYLDQLRQLD
jgi:hypothetical protein